MTRLCVPIFVTSDIDGLERAAMLAKNDGADLLELRLDDLALNTPYLLQLRAFLRGAPLPCVLTCRPTSEGGRSILSARDRFLVLEEMTDGAVEYVDFELTEASSIELR